MLCINKKSELGNYDVKGFCVDLYGLKTQELKTRWDLNEVPKPQIH